MELNNMNASTEERLMDEVDFELSDQFTFDGFEVVRGEFFSHRREPCVSFADGRMYANAASVTKLDDADYVQLLVNSTTKMLALKPCDEDAKDSFLWRRMSEKKGRYVAKTITCRVLFEKLCNLMNWSPDNRYKLLGKLIKSNGEYLFLFDLNSVETFVRLNKEGNIKRSRVPMFPAGWENQFGLSVEEHSKQLQVNIFEGYAVFDVTHKEQKEKEEDTWQNQENQPSPLIP